MHCRRKATSNPGSRKLTSFSIIYINILPLPASCSPILTYNGEVWGLFIKSDFKFWDTSPIEKGHFFIFLIQFCKRYLQVNNKASNIAYRAELGRYTLIFVINKRILKYISYLQNKEQSSLVIQSLVMSIDLHRNGKTSFYTNLITMLNSYNIPFNFNHDTLDDTKIHFVDSNP